MKILTSCIFHLLLFSTSEFCQIFQKYFLYWAFNAGLLFSQQNQRQKVEIKFLEKDLDYLREIKEKLFDREILAACLASGAAFVSPIGVLWDKLGPFLFSLICAWQFLLLIFSYISPPITSYPPNCKIFRRNVEWRNIFCGDCRIMPRLNCWAESTAASSFFTY